MPSIAQQVLRILKPMSGIDFAQSDETVPSPHACDRLRHRGVSEELDYVKELARSVEMIDHKIDHVYAILDVDAEAQAGPGDDRVVHVQKAAKIARDLVPEGWSIGAADCG
ncbi:hypothetical protein RRH01S_02_05780 [Rhizobium rhizogenes NBRC 13257]|uniref:Uncharacterized protein n=1 Tax=Rhizobium rhizogenes NBRC 13257 TaxID=1220581 RepID=A0AA87Q3Z1_RHIRH|nr:hypothetical protein RRH01S_02_05780 [Rhizobium rhizogenes NBRC 13257]